MLQIGQITVEASRQLETNLVFSSVLTNVDRQISALGPLEPTASMRMFKSLGADRLNRFFDSDNSYRQGLSRTMINEASKRLATVAIALKRFQSANGHLPENLSGLAPEFLATVPLDPADGHPLRYRRNADGTFVLYSIGEDGVDDGGKADLPKASNTDYPAWFRGADWVWPQPATPEEIQKYYETIAR